MNSRLRLRFILFLGLSFDLAHLCSAFGRLVIKLEIKIDVLGVLKNQRHRSRPMMIHQEARFRFSFISL
jgi:hypothetical protein